MAHHAVVRSMNRASGKVLRPKSMLDVWGLSPRTRARGSGDSGQGQLLFPSIGRRHRPTRSSTPLGHPPNVAHSSIEAGRLSLPEVSMNKARHIEENRYRCSAQEMHDNGKRHWIRGVINGPQRKQHRAGLTVEAREIRELEILTLNEQHRAKREQYEMGLPKWDNACWSGGRRKSRVTSGVARPVAKGGHSAAARA